MKEYSPDLWLLASLEQDGNTQVTSYNASKCWVSDVVLLRVQGKSVRIEVSRTSSRSSRDLNQEAKER